MSCVLRSRSRFFWLAAAAALVLLQLALPATAQGTEGSISGQFHFDEDGLSVGPTESNLLSGVLIELEQLTAEMPGGETVGSITTGDDGAYLFSALSAGRYLLTWELPDGIVSDESLEPINLPAGTLSRAGNNGLWITLEPGGQLAWDIGTEPANVLEIEHFWDADVDGELTDDDSQLPASSVSVSAYRVRDDAFWLARPIEGDTRGGLVIPDLPAGEYRLLLSVSVLNDVFLPTVPGARALPEPWTSLDASGPARILFDSVGQTKYVLAGYGRAVAFYGTVFHDLDADGIHGSDEPIANGVAVSLTSTDHPLASTAPNDATSPIGTVAQTVTELGGRWEIYALEGFTYRAMFATPAPLDGLGKLVPTIPGPPDTGDYISRIGPDGGTPAFATIAPSLGSSPNPPDLGAGFRLEASGATGVDPATIEPATLPSTGANFVTLGILAMLLILAGRRMTVTPSSQ